MLKWEEIKEENFSIKRQEIEYNSSNDYDVLCRAKVEDGWLVKSMDIANGISTQVAIVFVLDPKHKWKLKD